MKKENIILWLLAALTPVSLIYYFSPNSNHYLAWTAFVPLWYAVLRLPSMLSAFSAAFVCFYAAYFFSLDWMRGLFGWQAWFFYAIFSFWPILHALVLRKLWEKAVKSFQIWLMAFSLSALYAGLEYFRSELWPLNCPWLGLGYAQFPNPHIYQSLSIWGVFGLTFFVIFFNISILIAILKRHFSTAAFSILIMLSLFLYGHKRLEINPQGAPVKALLVQDETYSLEKLLSMSKTRKDEELIIWPENSFYLKSGEKTEDKLRQIQSAFKNRNFYALIPIGVKEKENGRIKRENYAVFFDLKTGGKQIYEKMHPVPFVETGLKKGPCPSPLDFKGRKIGVQICYDLNFENGSRILAGKGAEIILAPTNDPIEWTAKQQRQHADMSAARAVENGLWILRPATSGISQVIDDRGRIIRETASGESLALSGQAEMKTSDAFYTKYGWIIPKLFLLVSALTLIAVFI